MFSSDRKGNEMKRNKKHIHTPSNIRTLLGILLLCILGFSVSGVLEREETQPSYESEAYLPDEGITVSWMDFQGVAQQSPCCPGT